MSSIPIPKELIPQIIAQLAYEKQTLHSLLTVNKLCFNAAASVLYRNPFRPCYWSQPLSIKKRDVLYLLLASAKLLRKLTKYSKKILVWASSEWEPPLGPFTVNYLQYYTEIDYSQWDVITTAAFSYVVSNSRPGPEFGHFIHLLFCKYNARNIKSVSLPILDMKPYLPLAVRLSSLRRIEFCRVYHDEILCTNNQNIVTIQDAIRFIKIHVKVFDDTLTEIKIPDLTDLKFDGIRSNVRISDIIRILKRPQVIDVADSYDFCQFIQGPIDNRLRVLNGPFMRYSEGVQDWDSASLLQRCPKLEKIRFSSTEPNSFRWAVERRDSLINSDSSSSNQPAIKLAPLQDVHIMYQNCAALPIVQDIIYAFRDTIKNIDMTDHQPSGLGPEPLCWDWLLPNLVKILINQADFALFDFGSLNFCPSLEELCLISRYEHFGRSSNSSSSSGTVTDFGPVLRLPNLRKIRLEHGVSYQFNFDSLKYSPLLESLILKESGSCLPIRPENSPCWAWTWDWNLPHLKQLDLAGESAILFQFRFLESCPPLEHLTLSTERYHRSLSLDEIPKTNFSFRSKYVIPGVSNNGFSCSPKYVLNGRWELSGKTLFVLSQRYMSHVVEIHLNGNEGFAALDVIYATHMLPRARFVYSTLYLTDDDVKTNAMFLKDCKVRAKGWKFLGSADSVNYVIKCIPAQNRPWS
ncbi:hypothetical protein K7432_003849 [Basidiobolus ranarum]|uniref:F-box domain-containing protein n=1 Tax=Basidiobolus ranarum TaxID=34480 RepID=A0ABR2WZ46_9FUNG